MKLDATNFDDYNRNQVSTTLGLKLHEKNEPGEIRFCAISERLGNTIARTFVSSNVAERKARANLADLSLAKQVVSKHYLRKESSTRDHLPYALYVKYSC